MALREIPPPQQFSIIACIAAVVIGGALWKFGHRQPEKYIAQMTYNSHASVAGYAMTCYQCHQPAAGNVRGQFQTALTCFTSYCHGDLKPEHSREQRMEHLVGEFSGDRKRQYTPDEAEHFLDLHQAVEGQSCWTCHTEHHKTIPPLPPGFQRWGEQDRQDSAERPWRPLLTAAAQ